MNDRPSPVSGACLSAVPALIGSLNVAVVLHLFYEDQWPEFRDAMTNIRHPFQLFVSLRPESKLEAEILRDHPTAVVRKVANLGRDVAPFLAFLPQLQAYDAVCKLHSKRSQGGHEAWRLSFGQGLLGSPETVEAYLGAFARDPDLALAGPRLWYIDGRTYLGQTEQALTLQHGVLPTGWGFFAGTMFWCNPRAFAGLDRIYPQDVFTAHTDTDGHPEHALERVFGLVVYQTGKKILLWDGAATLDLATNMRPGLKFSETYRDLSLISDDAQQPTASRSNAGAGHSLLDIYDNHQGFVSDKWTNTLLHYDRIMPQFRDREVRLLEIGVQNGGSLEIWSTYFPLGRIFVGCDIDPACESLDYADPRIKIVCADAAAPFSRTKIMELSGQFDVIIDDGSHRSGDIISAFLQFFPVLAPGGIYVIEDLHCSYWPEYEGGLDLETSALAFFRRLTDVINQEHWRVEIDLAGRFGAFADAYDLEIDADMFQSIVSIEFANSLVVVRKGWPQDSLLGKRRVRGKVAKVHASVLQGDGSFFSAPRVTRSSGSALSAPAAIGSDAISLSVVVPFLNGSTYLPEAIRSVQQQTRPAREIIVVDDGSAPNEARWLASFAKDADLRVVTQANTGQGGARNAGMAATTGTHICLLDQDDLFLPHHNEALVESWRATVRNMPKLGMVFADLQMRDETRGIITQGVFPHTANPVPGTIEEYVARDLTMYPCTTMIDRAAALGIGGFDSTLRGFEDDDFYLRLVLAGREIGFCPQIIATWRKHSAQSSQSTDFVRSAETFFRKWLAYSWPADVSPAIARTNLRTRLLVNCRLMQKDRSPYLHSAIRQLEHVVISTPDPAT